VYESVHIVLYLGVTQVTYIKYICCYYCLGYPVYQKHVLVYVSICHSPPFKVLLGCCVFGLCFGVFEHMSFTPI
jgi:hypothetical protein